MSDSDNRDLHLQALIRSLQQDADLEVDMWREVGNAIIGYTNSKKALLSKLLKAFERLERPPQVQSLEPRPLTASQMPNQNHHLPTQNPSYPAYQNAGTGTAYPAYSAGYPSTSAQPPWPPEYGPQPEVPTATVPRNGNGQPPPLQKEWRLGDALRNAAKSS